MSFLPPDYKEPTSSNYVKLEQGTTKLRILTNPIMGWVYWTEDEEGKHPIRVRTKEEVPSGRWLEEDNRNKPKFFWAMLVWNYKDNTAQIWEITQATIRGSLIGLAKDENWGDPKNYDINVTRKGEKKETEYTVVPIPHTPFKYESKVPVVNVEALFDGEDPFSIGGIAETLRSKQEQIEDILSDGETKIPRGDWENKPLSGKQRDAVIAKAKFSGDEKDEDVRKALDTWSAGIASDYIGNKIDFEQAEALAKSYNPKTASNIQKKTYLAAAKTAGYDAETAKAVAERTCELTDFSEITFDQCNKMTGLMSERIKENDAKAVKKFDKEIDDATDGVDLDAILNEIDAEREEEEK